MAIRFDAATDRISFIGTVPDPSAGITIAGWAYISVDTDNNAVFIRVHASDGGSTTINFATDSDGLGGPGYFTAGGSLVSSTNMVVAAWRKVAITCTGTSGTLYVATPISSTEVDSGSVGGAASPTGLTFGARAHNDGDESLNGRIAYWRIWTAVLSQAQIESNWLSTTPVTTANLWADWPLATAADLTDHSGNGRHLVAGTTAVTTEDGPPLAASVSGTATADLGGLAGTATGTRSVVAVTSASLAGPVATANGTTTVVGAASSQLGGLTATGSGLRTVTAVAATTLGALTATVTGTRTVTASLAASLGALIATITGDVVSEPGSAAANLGALIAAVTGLRTVVGSAVSPLGVLTAQMIKAAEVTAARTRISGREPYRSVSGREPRDSI